MNYLPNTGATASALGLAGLLVTGSVMIAVGIVILTLFVRRRPDTGN